MMKSDNFFKLLTNSKFCLLGIGVGLIAIHLTSVLHTGDDNLLSTSILFWSAVCSLLSKKRNELNLKSDFIGSFLGIFLITIVLLKSKSLANFDFFIRLSPLLSALSLALIASGIKGLKQYWQELFILCFLIPHSGFLSQLLDISKLTAKFAASLLWYLGFEVSRQGVTIVLHTGSVEVNPGCSGYSSIVQLLGIAVIFLAMFTTTLTQKFIVPIVAVILGFIVNVARVAIMAVLVSYSNHKAFLYWHNEDGSLIFSVISVLLFGLFCFFILQQDQTVNQ